MRKMLSTVAPGPYHIHISYKNEIEPTIPLDKLHPHHLIYQNIILVIVLVCF